MTEFQLNKSEKSVSIKSAIVIGATGLVGKQLVQRLVSSGRYATVYQIVRRPSPQSNSQSTVAVSYTHLDVYKRQLLT